VLLFKPKLLLLNWEKITEIKFVGKGQSVDTLLVYNVDTLLVYNGSQST